MAHIRPLILLLALVSASMMGLCKCDDESGAFIRDRQDWETIRERFLASSWLPHPSKRGRRISMDEPHHSRTAKGIKLSGAMEGFEMYPTRLIVGRTIKSVSAGMTLCINFCKDTSSCKGVSWCAKTLTCMLKAEVTGTLFNATTDTFCKTGINVPEPEPCPATPKLSSFRVRNTDIAGNNMGMFRGNLSACSAYCQSLCACAGFVRYRRICYLKYSLDNEVTFANRTLFVRPVSTSNAVYARLRVPGHLGVNTGDGYKMKVPEVASWLAANKVKRVKLFHSYENVIRGYADFQLIIGIENANLYKYAAAGTGVTEAQLYVSKFVRPFPHVTSVAVGNEAFASWNTKYAKLVAPAMQNLFFALRAAGLSRVKLVTPLDYACIFQSSFNVTFAPSLKILKLSSSPFVVNPYPHFACKNDQRIRIEYCLGTDYKPTATNPTSMLDAQVREVRKIQNKLGCPELEFVIGETGWPTRGSSPIYNIANQEKYLASTARFAEATRMGVYLFQLQDGSSDSYGMLTNPSAEPKCVLPTFF